MEQVALWTVIALCALAGAWRSAVTTTPGVPGPGSWLERGVQAVFVGIPAGAAVGFLVVLAYAAIVGP